MELRPWKCGEMVFITSEGVEIWLKIKRGTQGKSAMKKIFHKMIKGQDKRMLRYESRCIQKVLGNHYMKSTHINKSAQWNLDIRIYHVVNEIVNSMHSQRSQCIDKVVH
jgi:hypothetical protein